VFLEKVKQPKTTPSLLVLVLSQASKRRKGN